MESVLLQRKCGFMKITGAFWFLLLFTLLLNNTGCTFAGGDIVLPDISSLNIQRVSTFVAGDPVTVTLYSSSLNPGTYMVRYKLSGANVLASDSATVLMYNDSGSFTTPALPNPGNTTLTLTEITTSSGGNAWISNTVTFSDSLGLMTANVSSGTFRAIHVVAALSGTSMTLYGIQWKPLDTMLLTIDNFAMAPGTYDLNTDGYGLYSVPGKRDSSQHGVVTVTTAAPFLTGTFSFTNKDSTKVVAGVFSCVAP
jgi:hypothetical protein